MLAIYGSRADSWPAGKAGQEYTRPDLLAIYGSRVFTERPRSGSPWGPPHDGPGRGHLARLSEPAPRGSFDLQNGLVLALRGVPPMTDLAGSRQLKM